MPVLKNTRHERFCQEFSKGLSLTEAYAAAGFKPSRQNAYHLFQGHASVRERVAELQELRAEETELTVAGLTEDLMRIAKKAEDEGSSAALNVARASLMDAAKLNGLLIERTENKTTTYVVDNRPATEDEWAEEYASVQ